MAKPTTIDITVRSGSAYVTNTVRGQRASSTHSAGEAARGLGRKLFGGAFQRAEELPGSGTHTVTLWRLYGDASAGATR